MIMKLPFGMEVIGSGYDSWPLLVLDVVVEGAVVVHDEQRRQPLCCSRPQRLAAHEEVAVTEDRDRQSATPTPAQGGATHA